MTDSAIAHRKNGRNADGRFAAGNPGKAKGTRHRATQAVQTLLEGEAESLTRKAVEMALAGDVTALRLCLDRIAPARRESPIAFSMPRLAGVSDIVPAAAAIIAGVAKGELSPAEGAHVMALVESFRRVMESAEIGLRIEKLEEKLG